MIFIIFSSSYIYGHLGESKLIHVWFSYERGLIVVGLVVNECHIFASLYIYGYLCENKLNHVWFSYERGLIMLALIVNECHIFNYFVLHWVLLYVLFLSLLLLQWWKWYDRRNVSVLSLCDVFSFNVWVDLWYLVFFHAVLLEWHIWCKKFECVCL